MLAVVGQALYCNIKARFGDYLRAIDKDITPQFNKLVTELKKTFEIYQNVLLKQVIDIETSIRVLNELNEAKKNKINIY